MSWLANVRWAFHPGEIHSFVNLKRSIKLSKQSKYMSRDKLCAIRFLSHAYQPAQCRKITTFNADRAYVYILTPLANIHTDIIHVIRTYKMTSDRLGVIGAINRINVDFELYLCPHIFH